MYRQNHLEIQQENIEKEIPQSIRIRINNPVIREIIGSSKIG